MKASETPKSKFVYPDKLYARCKDNKTLDMSYAPQNMEAVEYYRTDAFIEKACDAYCKVCGHYAHTTPNHICRQACDYYKDFRKYMKGE